MLTTTIAIEGNLAADTELRNTNSDKAQVVLVVLVNHSRKDEATGEWVDGEPTRHTVKVFGQQADNVAKSLMTGNRVVVIGRVVTESWNDKETGEKRTKQVVLADVVAVSLRWAITQINKPNRREHQELPAADGWATEQDRHSVSPWRGERPISPPLPDSH